MGGTTGSTGAAAEAEAEPGGLAAEPQVSGAGVDTLPGMMTRMMAPAAESIEWAGLTAMAKLPTNSARSRLATVPHATLIAMNGHDTRNILGQGNLDDTITIKEIREGLVTAPGDRMDLTKGREKTLNDIIGSLRGTVAQIDKATPGVGTHHTERDITEVDSRGHNMTTIK